MTLDIDQILATALPWDLTVIIDCTSYEIRPLVMADIVAIEEAGRRAAQENRPHLLEQAARSLLLDLEEDEPLTSEQAGAILAGVIAYFGELRKKKWAAIAPATRTAVQAAMAGAPMQAPAGVQGVAGGSSNS